MRAAWIGLAALLCAVGGAAALLPGPASKAAPLRRAARHHPVAVRLALNDALPAQADAGEGGLVSKVRRGIADAVKYLRSQQRDDGSWEGIDGGAGANVGGATSLALLALLHAGVPPDDPAFQKGLRALRKVEPRQTYVVGLQTMVFALARQPQDRERIRRNVEWLIAARSTDGDRLNGWGYQSRGSPDNSNTQYALLGLHEAHNYDPTLVKPEVWQSIRDYYVRTQRNDGGWGYKGDAGSTVTMSTAGLCGLLIANMNLNAGRESPLPDGSFKNCGNYEAERQVQKALDWLGGHFPTRERFAGEAHLFYALYGIERAGRLSGQRFFGEHDWYRIGCEFLVERQQGNGSWAGLNNIEAGRMVPTCFALLFLSKGHTPVLISKLAHNPDWNNDRNDAHYLTDFCSRELFVEKSGRPIPLAWQVFDVRGLGDLDTKAKMEAVVKELLQSPVVYLTGHHAPRLSGVEKEILKKYIENGGFLLAEACCGDKRFDAGFRELMEEMFGRDYPLKPLPAEHPVWRASDKFQSLTDRDRFPLEGIEMGCRTVVIYCKTDLSCWWESNQYNQGQGQRAFRLGANIIAYATGKEPPKDRLAPTQVLPDAPEDKRPPRGALRVAQLKHGGDWQAARKAMRNLMLEVGKEGIDVAVKPEALNVGDDGVFEYLFFYLHGRSSFHFSKEELKKLRFCLEKRPALLLADACCGSRTFDQSFRKFVADLFPDRKLELVPLSDELFSKELNGTAIKKVRCRREGAPSGQRPEVDPHLEGIKVDGRWVLIYSKYDLGCALEHTPSPDCLGHDYGSALRLAKAAVWYAMKR